jgi:hypothetical protein
MCNGCCDDETVGGIAMEIFKFNREQRYVTGEWEFENARVKQFCS